MIKTLKLGCQVSIAGKIYDAIERASHLGCNTMQIFARNPRQWRKGCLAEEDIKIFKEKVKIANIKPVVVHIPYTLNLAATKESFHKITIREFTQDLLEADKLGVEHLVTHMGSYKGSTEEKGLLKIVKALKKILAAANEAKTMLLLENTSGSGSWLGYKFSHHKFILEGLNWPQNIGLCLDTAHCFAAGYAIDSQSGLDELIAEIDEQVGLERLKVIHLNDTREKLGSLKDRHCDIGRGNIGKKGFHSIVNHPALCNLPFILETPKDNEEDDLRNIAVVKELYDGIL
ncbi:MAG: deoxyribonuclease IV [Candidatus Omnitrophota bacterium]